MYRMYIWVFASTDLDRNISIQSQRRSRFNFPLLVKMTDSQLPQSHVPPKLSFTEKASLPLRVLIILVKAAAYFATRIFGYKNPTRRLIGTAIGRNVSSMLTVRQIQAIQPPTGVSVAKFCETQKLEHHVVELKDTDDFSHASLHFMDCQPDYSGPILLYFHGGGFIFPIMNPGHIQFARSAAQNALAKLAILEYTLAPELQYPGQLAQSAAALRFLLQHRNGDASSIMIGGDSAGGSMTMGLLAHLSEPHPRVSPVPLNGTKLRAVLCVSTRFKNSFAAPSYRTNASKDLLGPALINKMLENWKPDIEDLWTNPMTKDGLFWKNMKAKKALMIIGGDELYLDDNKEFAKMVDADIGKNAAWKLVVCPGEAHDQAINDIALGVKDGVMFNETMKWIGTA